MYFWRIEKLKAEMAARPLSDREALPYLVVFAVLSTAVAVIPQSPLNVWDGLGTVWGVVLTVIGTIYIYRQNGGAKGRYFLQRYLAVSWVVTLRWLAVIMVAAMAFFVILDHVGISIESTTWYEFLFLAAAETVIYWRTGHYVRDIATRMPVA